MAQVNANRQRAGGNALCIFEGLQWATQKTTFAENSAMIHLAPLQPESSACFYKWIGDPEVIEYSLSAFQAMKTAQQVDAWLAATLQDGKSLNLGIYLEATNELIGYAGLSGISTVNQSGEYFILIGEKACWGQGIGTEVTKQVLAIGFHTLQLNRIMLTVSETNTGGLQAYRKAGFIEEGRLRKACLRRGLFHDKIIMSVLKSEWQHDSRSGVGVPAGQ